MQYLLLFVLSLAYYGRFTSACVFFEYRIAEDITYEEIKQLNGSCGENRDTCVSPRKFTIDNMPINSCHCHKFCVNARTCCLDSPYINLRPTVPKPSCKSPYGNTIKTFIVDSCPHGTYYQIKKKCEGPATDHEDRLRSVVTVTSLATNITYWNYYCFRCNEGHDEFLYWDVRLYADVDPGTVIEDNKVMPVYNRSSQSWLAPFGENGKLVDVIVSVEYPEKVYWSLKFCVPNITSSCAKNWVDNEIRRKCNHRYMLVTTFYRNDSLILYKNPHCALCNFENLNDKGCYIQPGFLPGPDLPFSYTLDMNKIDADKCENDYVWDPCFKTCRKFKCGLARHIYKDGNCTEITDPETPKDFFFNTAFQRAYASNLEYTSKWRIY